MLCVDNRIRGLDVAGEVSIGYNDCNTISDVVTKIVHIMMFLTPEIRYYWICGRNIAIEIKHHECCGVCVFAIICCFTTSAGKTTFESYLL